MSNYVSGGGNLLALSSGIDSDHAISASTYADIDLELVQNTQVQVTRDSATGYYGFVTDSTQTTPTVDALLEVWAPALTSGEVEEVTFTDGVTAGGTTGAAPDLIGINYGAIHTDSSINKRKITVAIVKAQLDSGNYTEQSGTMVRTNLTFVGQKAKQAVTVPAAMFCTSLVSGATDTTIAANSGGKQVWFTPAS